MKKSVPSALRRCDTDFKLQGNLKRDYVSVPPGVPVGAGRGPPLGGTG